MSHLSFKTYQDYLLGLKESLLTAFYGDTFPEYEKECDEQENIDTIYIQHFIQNGLDVNEGLGMMIDTICSAPRWATKDTIKKLIQPFINSGANINLFKHQIFFVPYITDINQFEDATDTIYVRSIIINQYNYILGLYINQIYNWDNVQPLNWEDIIDYYQKNKCDDMDYPFLQYYKYLFLQNNDNDDD